MKVLFPVDEAYPLFKIGGLGDVGGSLPKALKRLGEDVRILLPKHPEIDDSSFTLIKEFFIIYDQKHLKCQLYSGLLPDSDITVYLLGEDTFISKKSDASDNHADKFAVFCLGICKWLSENPEWMPDVVHYHDWHTSFIPLIWKDYFGLNNLKFILSIHNLAYQGRTTTPVLEKIGFKSDYIEGKKNISPENQVNFLLEGIRYADAIVAVSPQYAKEILTPEYGEGIDGLLRENQDHLVGILNGLDLETFNPSKDKDIVKKFDVTSYQSARTENKKSLLKEFNLNFSFDKPLIGFVGRVDRHQKGIQLLIEAIGSGKFDSSWPFIFLGTGDVELENQLADVCKNNKNIRLNLKYDEALASKIYSSCELMLIPSAYEPCGLVQLIAMRYGALPVARATGGLVDTITHQKNGFLFEKYETDSFVEAIKNALVDINNPKKYHQMVKSAMTTSMEWDHSARLYQHLYT